jgi:CheY-like chemotaxis protein
MNRRKRNPVADVSAELPTEADRQPSPVEVAPEVQASGYRVISAASGREALAILAQQAGTVDLLLTDGMMPGLNGPQLVAMVRHWWPALRRLYMTGGADDSVLKLMRDSHTEWLQKPFTEDELREALDAVLRDAGELATHERSWIL